MILIQLPATPTLTIRCIIRFSSSFIGSLDCWMCGHWTDPETTDPLTEAPPEFPVSGHISHIPFAPRALHPARAKSRFYKLPFRKTLAGITYSATEKKTHTQPHQDCPRPCSTPTVKCEPISSSLGGGNAVAQRWFWFDFNIWCTVIPHGRCHLPGPFSDHRSHNWDRMAALLSTRSSAVSLLRLTVVDFAVAGGSSVISVSALPLASPPPPARCMWFSMLT